MICNIQGKCKCKPNGKNCMNPTPEEAIKIVEVIINFAIFPDELRCEVQLYLEAEKVALETQTEEKCNAAHALKQEEHKQYYC